jgi:hypothetical protein
MPRARALIDGASLGPEALKATGQAFDQAWTEIAPYFHGAAQIETARTTLASAILSVADNSSRDIDVLKKSALRLMTRNSTSLPLGADPSLAIELLNDKGYPDYPDISS